MREIGLLLLDHECLMIRLHWDEMPKRERDTHTQRDNRDWNTRHIGFNSLGAICIESRAI